MNALLRAVQADITRLEVDTVRASLPGCRSLEEVVFCCFSASDLGIYQRLLSTQGPAT